MSHRRRRSRKRSRGKNSPSRGRQPLEEWSTEKLIELFAAKAPVCVCRPRRCAPVSWCGPQKLAYRAGSILDERGISWPEGVAVAMSHAIDGEGRAEFDDIMKRWAQERRSP